MEVLPEALIERTLLTPIAATPPRVAPRPIPVTESAPPLRQILGVVTLAWVFGSVWQMVITGGPITLFAQKLGASNWQFGLLTAIPFVASLMSIPGSLLIELTGLRKPLFLAAFYTQRSMGFVIALAPLWVLTRNGWAAAGQSLTLFLWLMFAMYAVGSLGAPAWTCWMADVVPSRLNGKYFSRRRQWGNLSAVPAAVFVGWFLDHSRSPDPMVTLRWCAILFLCCAVCGLTDIHLFQYVPAVSRPPRDRAKLLESFKAPLADRAFLRVSGYVGVLTFAVNLLGQFATLYLLQQAGATNMAVQMIVVVSPMLAQLLVLGVWGRAADRMGKRPLLVLASIGLIPVALAWCFVSPDRLWLGYLLSAAGAALWAGVEVVNMNLVLEASAGSRGRCTPGGSAYAAVNTVIVNVAGCLGGLTAGVLAQVLANWHWQPSPALKQFGFFDVLFAGSAALRLGAVLLLLPLIHDPAARSTWDCARFIGTALLSGVAKLARLPLCVQPARSA